MLTRALKMAFWILYDHLGKLMVANFVWAISIAIPGSVAATAVFYGEPPIKIWIGAPAATVAVGIILPVLSVGLAHLMKVLIDRKDGSLSDFLDGIRRFGWKASRLGLLYTGAMVCFGTSVWFYATKLQASAPFVGYLVSAIAFWCLAFVALSAQFALPALVQKREGIAATLKLSALLLLDNPVLAAGVAFQIAVLTVLTAPIWPLFFVIYGAAVMALVSSAYELMARKYAVAAARSDGSVELPPRDEDDDYLNRGVRDVFFPWKG